MKLIRNIVYIVGAMTVSYYLSKAIITTIEIIKEVLEEEC